RRGGTLRRAARMSFKLRNWRASNHVTRRLTVLGHPPGAGRNPYGLERGTIRGNSNLAAGGPPQNPGRHAASRGARHVPCEAAQPQRLPRLTAANRHLSRRHIGSAERESNPSLGLLPKQPPRRWSLRGEGGSACQWCPGRSSIETAKRRPVTTTRNSRTASR